MQNSNGDLMDKTAVLELEAAQIIRPDQEGWLACPGDTLQHWRLLWFVVKEDVLLCFDHLGARCRGGISLAGFNARPADTDLRTKNAIKIYHPDGRVHYFVAQNREEAQAWLAALVRGTLLGGNDVRHGSSATLGPIMSRSSSTILNAASPGGRTLPSPRARTPILGGSLTVDDGLRQIAEGSSPTTAGSELSPTDTSDSLAGPAAAAGLSKSATRMCTELAQPARGLAHTGACRRHQSRVVAG